MTTVVQASRIVQVQQLPQSQPSTASRMIKNAAIFGAVGAAAGAALSFTALPIVGVASAPIAAAIGGAIGVLAGIVTGFLQGRAGNHAGAGVSQLPPVAPPLPNGSVQLPPPLPPSR